MPRFLEKTSGLPGQDKPAPARRINSEPGLFAGTSGWAYPSWKPGFYPAEVSSKKFLGWYAGKLNSVEVNYTFRKMPSKAMLEGWLSAVPEGFRFSFKAPQGITHFKRLQECDEAIAEFVAGLAAVRKAGNFGAVLFQLPPNFKADQERLAKFLKISQLRRAGAPRIAFEFRHESWFCEQTYATLRSAGAALCVAEADTLATPDVQTADFSYFRLRRGGGYKPREVKAFEARLGALAQQREVYVYFKHEELPTGALNAVAFRKAARARA